MKAEHGVIPALLAVALYAGGYWHLKSTGAVVMPGRVILVADTPVNRVLVEMYRPLGTFTRSPVKLMDVH